MYELLFGFVRFGSTLRRFLQLLETLLQALDLLTLSTDVVRETVHERTQRLETRLGMLALGHQIFHVVCERQVS
jgi:hypothetical protein